MSAVARDRAARLVPHVAPRWAACVALAIALAFAAGGAMARSAWRATALRPSPETAPTDDPIPTAGLLAVWTRHAAPRLAEPPAPPTPAVRNSRRSTVATVLAGAASLAPPDPTPAAIVPACECREWICRCVEVP
ncbi:MAG: hypothetical protein FWD17_09755 [Polyangiaceae bacterium]|nr:hypothetical protein [Polyangiaceae bacterium]